MRRVLSLVMQELLQTEKDYIRALNYVVDNYIPEILSEFVPQPLRGKKNVVFGNLQNICKFHSEAFLREIEACMQSPYQLGACFLQHVILSLLLMICNYYLDLTKSVYKIRRLFSACDVPCKHVHLSLCDLINLLRP